MKRKIYERERERERKGEHGSAEAQQPSDSLGEIIFFITLKYNKMHKTVSYYLIHSLWFRFCKNPMALN